MVQIERTIEDFRQARANLDGTVAFVPTMGALHEGHFSLMRCANEHADHLVVSIFVNPTQFGPDSDYEEYPRELERDREKCGGFDCKLIFAPPPNLMYAEDHSTTVQVEDLTDVMCGPHRPGHFEGVATIVTKLLNIVQPDVAVFGEKDYQQLAILQRMVRDLNIPVEIIGAPTARESDGLAVSSRNRYLDDQERRDARSLSEALARAWDAYRDGERDGDRLVDIARERLLEAVGRKSIDYVECVHPETLQRYTGDNREIAGDGAVMAMAVHVGEARLIDNLRLDGELPAELAP
jgi:pantoate--beta-alanine ligase